MTVKLYLDADGNVTTTGDQTFITAQATDATGLYQFLGLPNTTSNQKYVVKVDTTTLPTGFTATGESTSGSPNGLPCGSIGGCDNQTATTLTGGATIGYADFGYRNSTSYNVSGTVWDDQRQRR